MLLSGLLYFVFFRSRTKAPDAAIEQLEVLLWFIEFQRKGISGSNVICL
jgi:hypothetical protein